MREHHRETGLAVGARYRDSFEDVARNDWPIRLDLVAASKVELVCRSRAIQVGH
jgi:hypothetical protein